jgi:hypothetical protein
MITKPQTTAGTVYVSVTVAVVSTILQEHAFASKDADAGADDAGISVEDADVLFETTESNSSTPAAKTLAPRARIAGRVVVAVCINRKVVTVRLVMVVAVVKSALVVTVLWCY